MGTRRRNGFGQYVFTKDQIQPKISELTTALQPIVTAFESGLVSAPEAVAAYLISFLKTIRPSDFRGGRIKTLPLAPEAGCLREFSEWNFRGVPLAVNRSLIEWANGHYKLRLTNEIPTAEDLLRDQASGVRVVTWITDFSKLADSIEGRDAFGFVLHDLIHADQFFSSREQYAAQVEIYKELLVAYESGAFHAVWDNPGFYSDFSYVIADMNSHPAHILSVLEHTLKSYGVAWRPNFNINSQTSRNAPNPPRVSVI